MDFIKEISDKLCKMNKDEINIFFSELFTLSELSTISKRWQILKMLAKKTFTQREISKKLGVSLCKVTRGAKILKKTNTVIKKII